MLGMSPMAIQSHGVGTAPSREEMGRGWSIGEHGQAVRALSAEDQLASITDFI